MSRKAVGNWVEARVAQSLGYVPYSLIPRTPCHPRPGWTLLGSGATRTAYLSPTGVVYKSVRERFFENNLYEYEVYLRLRDIELPQGWFIPKTDIFSVNRLPVVAMEYIPGEPMREGRWAPPVVEKATGLYDLHHENVVEGIDGNFYIIDLGERH